jgi:epoxide hydrolase 4
MEPWTHHTAQINGLGFHYVEAGAGPPVVLLHGFPEFWYAWHHQIPALAAAGLRAVAPDLRGYNETDKPRGIENYRIDVLLTDIVRLVEHLGVARAHIVGHDWGGALAWQLAIRHPEVVDKLVILNAPHPAAFARELRTPGQWWRSSYMLLFRLPWLPERLLAAGNYALLRRILRRQPVRPGAFTPDDIERYRRALAQPGARTAALNYYRAAFRYRRQLRGARRQIEAPTLVIWGEQDPYLGVGLTRGLEEWVPKVQIQRLPNASHWVQNDAPEVVNEAMVRFLQSSSGTV